MATAQISFPSNDNSNSKTTVARYIEPLYKCTSVFNVSMVKMKLLGNRIKIKDID
jgi:hypothetical protein